MGPGLDVRKRWVPRLVVPGMSQNLMEMQRLGKATPADSRKLTAGPCQRRILAEHQISMSEGQVVSFQECVCFSHGKASNWTFTSIDHVFSSSWTHHFVLHIDVLLRRKMFMAPPGKDNWMRSARATLHWIQRWTSLHCAKALWDVLRTSFEASISWHLRQVNHSLIHSLIHG